MKLRSQILLFLLLFGLLPLFVGFLINVPLVLDRLELFYYKAHLQNLRADFRDLDQHLTSREATARLLAKLPEPGIMLGTSEIPAGIDIDVERARYTDWINRILGEQLDITQILFLDEEGRAQFWLERDPRSGIWEPPLRKPVQPSPELLEVAMRAPHGGALVSPIIVNPAAEFSEDPRRFLTLQLISPLRETGRETEKPEVAGDPIGAVVLTLDVGGMARVYRNTDWVFSDGHYLSSGDPDKASRSAFEDYPGLDRLFMLNKYGLWEGDDDRQVLWVPLFATENLGPLWVGRSVDPSPLDEFNLAIVLRVLGLVLAIVLFVLLGARWFAGRWARVANELRDGIGRVLQDDAAVRFDWGGPEELRTLAADLTRLAEKHAHNNRDLREHARALEQSNRYKSEFLANVSHELRTPLNSILLLSKLLADRGTGLSAEQAQQAGVIHEAAVDLRALIDNILDISRIEAGGAAFNIESVDPGELLQSVFDLVKPQFDAKGLPLTLKITDAVPEQVITDPDKVRQIIKNFLSNAVKFTEAGEVIMELDYDPATEDSQRPLRISVRDTGIGIAVDKQEVVFEAFQQADGSTSRRYGGTGLGLSISRKLAGLIGGTIILGSREGEGSVFSLLLPLVFDAGKAVGTPSSMPKLMLAPSAGSRSAIPEADFSGHRVLIVTEDVQQLLALTPMMESWGLGVVAAADVAEAVESLSEETIGLVLVDAMMPDRKGYDTIKTIHGDERFVDTRIVALAASPSETEGQACLQAGAQAVLARPAAPLDLKQVIESCLGGDSRINAQI